MLWLKIGAGLIGILILIILFLYFSIIKIDLEGEIRGLNGSLKGQIYLFRIRVFRFTVPKVHLEEDPLELIIHQDSNLSDEDLKLDGLDLSKFVQSTKGILDILKQEPLKKVFHLKKLRWETFIGTGEADRTAILTGVVWSLKTVCLKGVQFLMDLDSADINVVPFFNHWRFETSFSCMISFRLGKAIRQAFWIRKQLKRRRLLHGRSSHSRTHEDSA